MTRRGRPRIHADDAKRITIPVGGETRTAIEQLTAETGISQIALVTSFVRQGLVELGALSPLSPEQPFTATTLKETNHG